MDNFRKIIVGILISCNTGIAFVMNESVISSSNIPTAEKDTFDTSFKLALDSTDPETGIESIYRENSIYTIYNIGVDPETDLPFSYVFIHSDGDVEIGLYNSPTDIGYYFTYLVGVAKGDIQNDFLTQQDAITRLKHALEVLKSAPRKDGLLYWYDIGATEVKVAGYREEKEPVIPAIDNAFYASSLGLIIGAFIDNPSPEAQNLVKLAQELLEEQKAGWEKLYDPDRGLIKGEHKEGETYYIDDAYSEGRLAAFIAVVIGDVPRSAWDNLTKHYSEYTLSNGENLKILAPWTGAFQAWMPNVFIPEMDWSPSGYNLAHQRYLLVQKDWSERENMPAFYSEASDPFSKDEYKYIVEIAIPNGGSRISHAGIPYLSNIGSPYAIGLAYTVDKDTAEQKFSQLIERFPEIKGPFGWLDSVGREGYEPNVNWEISNAYVSKDIFVLLSALNFEQNHKYFIRFLQSIGKLDIARSLYQSVTLSF